MRTLENSDNGWEDGRAGGNSGTYTTVLPSSSAMSEVPSSCAYTSGNPPCGTALFFSIGAEAEINASFPIEEASDLEWCSEVAIVFAILGDLLIDGPLLFNIIYVSRL